MGMGPSVKTVDQRNAATPLSGDYLQMLRGQISQEAFGTGVGPLQRQAGKAAEQYVGGLQNRVTQGINTTDALSNTTPGLIQAITALSNQNTNRQAADLREGFGNQGTRFSSAVMAGEKGLRTDAGMNLDQLLANVLFQQSGREQQARQFDVQANMGLSDQLLAGISQLYGQGTQNLAPFEAFAQRGILNPEIIASPGIGSQLLQGGLGFLGSYLSGGGKIPGLGGGGSALGGGGISGGGGGQMTSSMPNGYPGMQIDPNLWAGVTPGAYKYSRPY